MLTKQMHFPANERLSESKSQADDNLSRTAMRCEIHFIVLCVDVQILKKTLLRHEIKKNRYIFTLKILCMYRYTVCHIY